jgi:hypothetical protein
MAMDVILMADDVSLACTMLNQLQWTTLQEHRAQAKACMMYRVVNQLIDIPSQILVPTISHDRGSFD